LPVEGYLGGQEEAGIIGWRYPITMSDRHKHIML
jgi:hypothetical protein